MIPEDRKVLGLFHLRSVLENIAIITNERSLVVNHQHEDAAVEELIKRLHIVTAGVR